MPAGWRGLVTGFLLLLLIRKELDRVARSGAAAERTTRILEVTIETLQRLAEVSPAAVVVIDPDGAVRLWSRAAERIFGWSAEEILGRPIPIVPEEAADEHMSLRAQVLGGGEVLETELRRMRKDGSQVDVLLNAAPIRDETGNVTDLIGVLMDISERKRAEEILHGTLARLKETGRELGPTDPDARPGGPDRRGRSGGAGWGRPRPASRGEERGDNHCQDPLRTHPTHTTDVATKWFRRCEHPLRFRPGNGGVPSPWGSQIWRLEDIPEDAGELPERYVSLADTARWLRVTPEASAAARNPGLILRRPELRSRRGRRPGVRVAGHGGRVPAVSSPDATLRPRCADPTCSSHSSPPPRPGTTLTRSGS